jgi:GH15 family glucan-1,4-alpha-glucosidase
VVGLPRTLGAGLLRRARGRGLVGLAVALAWAVGLLSSAGAAAAVERSFGRLVTGNGHAAVSFNRDTARVDTFLEHAYRFHEPRDQPENLCFSADESRDLAYDTYFGVRVDGVGTWLAALPVEEAAYEPGTHIIRVVQRLGTVRAETRYVMPFGLESPVLFMGLTLTNEGAAPVDLTPFALFNFHLGLAFGAREPTADGEEVAWDPSRSTLYEYGPSQGTIAYTALSPLAKATVSSGAASGFATLTGGGDLDDVRATAGPTTDVAPAVQGATTALAPGAALDFQLAITWALDEDAGPDVDAALAWLGGADPFAKARAEWTAWHAKGIANPAATLGLDPALTAQSLVMLRMGQVREPGPGFGQILASLPPGLGNVDAQWNIAWVRDMAYAVAGLIAAGHHAEARAALAFQLTAPSGRHTLEVGRPYRISVTRYFGNGAEESDCNADGPNIEFDGFGLFLWTLGLYVDATGDETLLTDHYAVIRDEIADVLVSLIDSTGVISADSSIWEVHWFGKQRRFTYTSLAAVRGLCDAAALATRLGHAADAARYTDAARGIAEALVTKHTDPHKVLVQSAEDLAVGSGYLDAATVEAVNWGIIEPTGAIATATRTALLDNLTVATGYGLMRNDDGGDYDSQEWVFVDLRLLPTLPDGPRKTDLERWLLDQAHANDLHIAELLDATKGTYRGSIPMIGFGGGAYLISTAPPMPAACGAYADAEPPVVTDPGPEPPPDTAPDTESDSESGSESDSASDTASDSESDTAPDSASESDSDSASASESESDSDPPPKSSGCGLAPSNSPATPSFPAGWALLLTALAAARRLTRPAALRSRP